MNRDSLYADPKLATYKRGEAKTPCKYWLWPLYGAGLESLGRDDKPIQVDIPTCGPDELLVRHDAVGLCFSDIKVVNAGENHPRLTGRDMKKDPVVLGHEVALTVIQVGKNRQDQFKPGDRFIVQADIYYKGKGLAYGYALQGGLSQFNVVGKEVIEGDEGCYLLPVKTETGYAEAALTEPWACVTASYDVEYRVGWKPGGVVLIAAGPGNQDDYSLGTPPYNGGQPPAQVIALGISETLKSELRQRAATDGFKLTELGAPNAGTLAEALQASGQEGFDDIVLLGSDVALYELLEPVANKGCILNIMGAQALEGKAQVDVGRLHYDNLSLTGSDGKVIAAAYQPVRTELKPGGTSAFIGAAGPMGQMHVQRVLEAAKPPRLAVATDLIPERLEVTRNKFSQLIEARRGEIELALRAPEGKSPAEFNASLMEMTDGAGFDDIVVLAPSAGVVAGAVPMLACNAVMNIFAGLPRGTKAPIDLSVVANRGVRFTGTSGSTIRDLRNMLNAAEAGQLNPNLSVVAVSGMMGAKQGLEGVVKQTFPGKVVIYPQIFDFPVTPLEELENVLPNVYAKLGPNHSWTVEAEAEFLRELLP